MATSATPTLQTSSDRDTLARALAATLSNNSAERQSAEALLQQLSHSVDHPSHLLQLAATHDPLVAPAAAVRLKNLLRASRVPPAPLSPVARDPVRTHILHVLSVTRISIVEAALAESIRWLISLDYPSRWHNLLPEISAFLSSGDASRVFASLLALRQLTTCYEFKSRDPLKLSPNDENDHGLAHPRQPLESLATACFPSLLALYHHLDALVAKPPDPASSAERDRACHAQRIIVKIFWSVTHFILPPCLAEGDAMDNWMKAFLTTFQRPCQLVNIEADEELLTVPEWKTKKWIAQVFSRFLRRYGSPKKIPVDEPWACTIADIFKTRHAEPVTVVVLDVLCSEPNGHQLSPRVAQICLDYIEEAIETARLWAIVCPRVDTLLTRVVFSYLCFSNADEELWESEPGEYVRKQYDFSEDLTSPRMAASNLLTKMGDLRSKRTVLPFLHYLMQSVFDPFVKATAGSPEKVALARQKVGAFASIAAVKRKLISKPDLARSLMNVLKLHVEPDLRSEFGFLRSESAWLMGQIASTVWDSFSKEVGDRILRGCVTLLEDREVPVQASAAGALQFLMDQEGATVLIDPVAPQLLERLLQLMDRMSDSYGSLLPAIDKLVERHSDAIMPVALPLVERLMSAFGRAAEGILRNGDDDDDDLVFTAAQVLHLLSSIIAAVGTWDISEKNRKARTLDGIEEKLKPLLSSMFQDTHQVFVEELLDVLGMLIAQMGEVKGKLSPLLLSLVPKMTQSVELWAADYVKEMLNTVEGYLTFAIDDLCAMENGLSSLIQMAQHLWSSKFDEREAICGAQIAEMIVMSLRKVDSVDERYKTEVVVRIGRAAAQRLVKVSGDDVAFREHLFTVVLECCYVDANNMLTTLGVQPVMQLIGAHAVNIRTLEKVYSKKGVMLGLCGILCTKGLVREESKVFLVNLILQLLHMIEDHKGKVGNAGSSGTGTGHNGNTDSGFSGPNWPPAVLEGKPVLLGKWDGNSLKGANGFDALETAADDDAASDLEDDEDALNILDEVTSDRAPERLGRLSGTTGLGIEALEQLSGSNGALLASSGLFNFDDLDDVDDDDVIGLGGHVLDEVDEVSYLVECVRAASTEAWWSAVSAQDRVALEQLAHRVEAQQRAAKQDL